VPPLGAQTLTISFFKTGLKDQTDLIFGRYSAINSGLPNDILFVGNLVKVCEKCVHCLRTDYFKNIFYLFSGVNWREGGDFLFSSTPISALAATESLTQWVPEELFMALYLIKHKGSFIS
jgi:hypothetical protein